MCGITGFINDKFSFEEQSSIISSMSDMLQHRGPDDKGDWVHKKNLLSFGHTRLSIVDLSKQGKQPMRSQSGNFVVTYNGEIYNFREIKRELISLNYKFFSNTDTEVLLASIETWGLNKALEKFEGMFAFALWDEINKSLTLARDRFGEKPLYYGWLNQSFLFSSELKPLKKHPRWKGQINLDALGLFFKYSYIPAPFTIFSGIKKLSSGSLLQVSYRDGKWNTSNEIKWWKPKISRIDKISYEEAQGTVEKLLTQAIDSQKEADVSVGSFLSSGIDSSLITALMQKQSTSKIKTFTIGFEYENYDESQQASKIANYLNTDHHEQIITSNDALNVIPLLPSIYDEPFADSSQIPTYLVSKLAKKNITVGLSGDGGDEIFCGYNRYLWAPKIMKNLKNYPYMIRKTLKSILNITPINFQNMIYQSSSVFLPKEYLTQTPIEKIEKVRKILLYDNEYDIYNSLESIWSERSPCQNYTEKSSLERREVFESYSDNFIERMVLSDINNYLSDDILVKLDRAAMANSLETRLPFLNHHLCNFSLSLPLEMKIKGQNQKRILKDILYKYVPKSLLDTPKTGFGVPLDSWMRSSLKEWVYDTLSNCKIKNDGLLDNSVVQNALHDHMSGKKNRQHELWNILTFQSWLKNE